MSRFKQVIVVRNDLNMRKGKMIAQGAHASIMFLVHRLYDAEVGGNDHAIQEGLTHGMTKILRSCGQRGRTFRDRTKSPAAELTAHVITNAGHTE